ncbi:flagellar hook-basal body protein [Paenibacillus guangzhouensis]|uniref:flagellar hook-basal body protein n=1 Tax=Paenibacillus guangzhouensis TaxID=1473112 RepID=UPI001266F172|nr:flagellar hook-basal body protein [Paenibacillus guangzhouensis]
MLRGLYTAAAGMITQQRRHDTVTNNIANINTPGYKQVNAVERSFPEMLVSLMGGDHNPRGSLGKLNTGVFAEESLPQYTPGDVTETGNLTDFALVANLSAVDPSTNLPIAFDANGRKVLDNGDVMYKPQAFFAVQNANGDTRYTRDGRFKVNESGELLSSTGGKVLDSNGQPITLNVPITSLHVNAKGQWIDTTSGQPAAGLNPIGITRIENPNLLVREGDGNYKFTTEEDAANNASPLGQGDNVELRQGSVERSNVDSAQSMVDMMAAARAYEANQKIIQYYDRSLDKAVNEVGRV